MSTPDEEDGKVLLTRPRDETWEAYKEFYVELCAHLGVEIPDEVMSDDERWKERTAKFWGKGKSDAKSE